MNGEVAMKGGGTTTKPNATLELTPAKSLWEVVNARSTRLANCLERNPAVAELVDMLVEAAVRYADIRGIELDEVRTGAVLTPDGHFVARFSHPYGSR